METTSNSLTLSCNDSIDEDIETESISGPEDIIVSTQNNKATASSIFRVIGVLSKH